MMLIHAYALAYSCSSWSTIKKRTLGQKFIYSSLFFCNWNFFSINICTCMRSSKDILCHNDFNWWTQNLEYYIILICSWVLGAFYINSPLGRKCEFAATGLKFQALSNCVAAAIFHGLKLMLVLLSSLAASLEWHNHNVDGFSSLVHLPYIQHPASYAYMYCMYTLHLSSERPIQLQCDLLSACSSFAESDLFLQ